MAIEIERKFLVATQGWRPCVNQRYEIRQAYLYSSEDCSIRVRIVDDHQAFLTIKTAISGFTRNEIQCAVRYDQACRLIELRQSEIIEKSRHCVDFAGEKWEVDQFHGRNAGLVIAEVELDNEEAEFVRPNWVGCEVTGQRRFHNSQLARDPFCNWNESVPDLLQSEEIRLAVGSNARPVLSESMIAN